MSAPTLFEAYARTTDPDTSHEAAAVDRSTQTLEVLSVVRAMGWVGATLDDVAEKLPGIRHGTLSRRLTDLEHSGLAEVAGKRKSAITGRNQRVYRAVGHLTTMEEAR